MTPIPDGQTSISCRVVTPEPAPFDGGRSMSVGSEGMDPQFAAYQPLMIHPGRRFGWWIEGRKTNGRLYMFTWWPTKALASFIARMWAALVQRITHAEVLIEMRETPTDGE
jgi:hypothetical protein